MYYYLYSRHRKWYESFKRKRSNKSGASDQTTRCERFYTELLVATAHCNVCYSVMFIVAFGKGANIKIHIEIYL